MRDQLAVDDGVHGEPRGLVGQLDLFRREVQARLDVRARDDHRETAGDVAGDHAVNVARHEPPHLPMAFDHLGESTPVGGGEPEFVPEPHAGRKRRMVHRDQRRHSWRRRQLGVEPSERFSPERSWVFTRACGVEYHEAHRTELDGVLNERAGDARDKHSVRLGPRQGDGRDGSGQSGRGIAVGPFRTDVRIAELYEKERPAHGYRVSSSSESWSSAVALATIESDWVVHGRPSISDTVAPASAASRLPAPACSADVQNRTYAETRPAAT